MALTLYHSPTSPFVRTVVVTAEELGQALNRKAVSTTPLNTDPTLPAANPLGKIPALERPDGPALYDSRVICRYLNDHAGGGLYPDAGLYEVLTLEALAHGIMEAAVQRTYETRLRAEETWSQPWLEAQWQKIARALDACETQWMSHLAGPLTTAQIALGCALSYLDFRHDDKGWRTGRDALAGWEAEFAKRPSMVASVPQ